MEEHTTLHIPGDYQYRANYLGPVFQRFFHHQRRLLIDWLLALRPGVRVLDAGCGSGVFAHYMASKGATVLGVDTNEDAVEFAARTFHQQALTFWKQPMHQITLPNSSIDRILLSEVLEHLSPEYLATVAAEFDRLLSPGGLLLATAPNYHSVWPLVEKLVDTMHLVPSLHEQHITKSSIAYLKRCPFNRYGVLKAVGCFNYLAPAVSLVSWRWAERVARLEFRMPIPGGLQIYGLWEKPACSTT
ncbi:MAG: class I SAM-dependent methyltransferase [Chloroflexi bacterium]|nr:class I SAM-dependent methyltransferase [Chloroflexota bacterium]